jgi:hypothetical protein
VVLKTLHCRTVNEGGALQHFLKRRLYLIVYFFILTLEVNHSDGFHSKKPKFKNSLRSLYPLNEKRISHTHYTTLLIVGASPMEIKNPL